MATHILTVDEITIKPHLNYMFIGTGKNGAPHQGGALADILSIREDDNIIFYVMKRGFFGIFKAVGEVFYDYNCYDGHHPQYLGNSLGTKTLTYRMRIRPKEVYKNYISEWDMMENPLKILNHSIFNMQWSWIFKKLKGNRGCISIDDKEFSLFKAGLIENNILLENANNFSYSDGKISVLNDNNAYDLNCTTEMPRSDLRLNKIYKEEDLRILFTAKANNHGILNEVLKPEINGNVNFIANEIACSFSERRMDLLFGTDHQKCILIELKNKFVYNESIYNQIKEYARWISAYKSQYKNIIPILILKAPPEVPKNNRGKYFQFLTKEKSRKGILSPWYLTMKNKFKKEQERLLKEGIPNLEKLEVYSFSIDENHVLTKITQLA
ncbi:EVE domain-containing protein [Salegentibacter sediminis]|uniref:hypothetical protein n=1 Tax=Salegentibacter sediminis TaxID=1930251 RepID=UPI0009C06B5B|nr:hypothetical protein [Salegentibacter sediminis]